ncbi:PoNe immunity protein domain-containing protein, partial [Aquabacterium parvum]|uniref:PoNe immunity protein domain-containing protein n=1 Tax=Aquabacterium parvum TaxID=70584 RepID=UPI000B2D985E
EQGGYHGYWSFEAGAAVILLGIEDDSSLHKYLYYPKDLVAWCREHRSLSKPDGDQGIRLRCEAGQPCPREGEWATPAQVNSRRFRYGEVMPSVESDYGQTIWQWLSE